MTITEGFEHIIRESEPLAPYTSMKLGGMAEYYAEPTNLEELISIVKRFREADMPVRLIGGGSNLLVKDEGTPGLVIRLATPAFVSIEVDKPRLTAGGGTYLSHLISNAVREGLAGPEQLVGIPGTVGGALHGNSGTHGGSIGEWVKSVSVLTSAGEVIERTGNDLSFGYRQSSLNELAIISATFEFEQEDQEVLTKRMQKLWIVNKSKQPLNSQNPGYIFKDTGGLTAADLIEQTGLKGASIGEVEVSERNPNFFLANPGATSEHVLRLIDLVRSQVHERTGIELELAIVIW